LRKPDDTTKPPRKQRPHLRLAKLPPASAPVFSAAAWAPLAAAFERAANALGSGDLAERDLPEDLQSGRLSSAMRRISPDGAVDTFERLDPSFWKEVEVCQPLGDDPDVEVYGLDAKLTASFSLFFFVARNDLDKLYPVDHALEPASNAPAAASDAPTRRKPEKRIRKNWKLCVAVELHRVMETEGKLPPPASYFATHCLKKLGYHPDISEIQKLIKVLL
jgi:hypothetical protein